MKAIASKRIMKHIASMRRSRLSEVLLVSTDGFEVSMMNSDAITTFHYMKMCTKRTDCVTTTFLSGMVGLSEFAENEIIGDRSQTSHSSRQNVLGRVLQERRS
jgi:hypothetical protein